MRKAVPLALGLLLLVACDGGGGATEAPKSAAAPATPKAATPPAKSEATVIANFDSWTPTSTGTAPKSISNAADTVVDAAKNGPITVTVTGHTDTRNSFGGTGDKNQKLSEDRAKAAADALRNDIIRDTGKTPEQLGITIETVGAGAKNCGAAGNAAGCRTATMNISSAAPVASAPAAPAPAVAPAIPEPSTPVIGSTREIRIPVLPAPVTTQPATPQPVPPAPQQPAAPQPQTPSKNTPTMPMEPKPVKPT